MNMKNSQLITVPYMEQFKYVCDISNRSSLLLDNMEVWALNKNVISKQIDFDIVMDSGEKYIIPRCKPEQYDEFLLKAERVYLVDETFEEMGKSIFV